MAASKQANIHAHIRNAVTVVWGSLRLAPKKSYIRDLHYLSILAHDEQCY